MREWVVGGAIIESSGGLLLVENRRPNGLVDWSPPGGVIDDGETLVEGLAREVLEETGLRVTEWLGPVYRVQTEAPDLGWRMRAEIHLAKVFEGSVQVDDPDGIVVDAHFVPLDQLEDRLQAGHPWVREPLTEWLSERWLELRSFGYVLRGRDLATFSVTRQ